MAKKTKKEKIIADLRRKLQVNNLDSVELEIKEEKSIEKNPSSISQSERKETENYTQNISLYSYPVHLIKRDLTKTLIISILAISFELLLYFGTEKQMFNFPNLKSISKIIDFTKIVKILK